MTALATWAGLHLTDVLTLLTLIGGVIAFWTQSRRAAQVREIELYQRLESNSIELFKFEAANAEVLEKFQDVEIDERKFGDEAHSDGSPRREKFSALQAKFGSMREFVALHYDRLEVNKRELAEQVGIKQQFELYEQQRLIVRKFYEQTLNLFEMATRFRNKRIIEPIVFGTWVIWFYDTVVQWGFRDHWPDLRQNYTADLRAVFNKFVAEFDPAEDNEQRKRRFYAHVAAVTHNCHIVRNWLPQLEKEARQFKFKAVHS